MVKPVKSKGKGKGWRRGMASGVACEQSTSELRELAKNTGVPQYGTKAEIYGRLQHAGVLQHGAAPPPPGT